jgi:hypothetical protein
MKTLQAGFAALALAACATPPARAQGDCPPPGYDRAQLDALKTANWEIADAHERRAVAQALAACVAAPDPSLRDGIAFEGLQHMLRARQLDVATQTALINDLLPRLQNNDPNGFEQPFAALVLSELARAERLNSHFTDDMRADVLDRAIAYFTGVRDYRGFDAREGWRHGVAHGADLLLQLSLNPTFGAYELTRIRDAIATQVAPEGHFYIYGEYERMAYPIVFIARRGFFSEAEWSEYFARFPRQRDDTFSSQNGLAWRHNVNAFLDVIYLHARLSEDANDDALLAGVEAAIRAMP